MPPLLARKTRGGQVAFGRLDGGVAKQKLDLLEGASGDPAEFRAGPPEIMGRELQTKVSGVLCHDPKDAGSGERLPHYTPPPGDRPEDAAVGDPTRERRPPLGAQKQEGEQLPR
jgi:hypothetical protein